MIALINVSISENIVNTIPDFKIGIVCYYDIVVDRSPQMLRGRLALFQENLKVEFESASPSSDPSIKEWRSIVKKLGIDPSKYRHSAEALLRRVKKGDSIASINSAVDLNNFFSLQYRIPFGIYDLDRIHEPVVIRVGRAEDQYEALNGRQMNMENKLLSSDQKGAFGSPFVDSMRTMVTEQTKQALQLIYLRPSMDAIEAVKLIDAVADMFVQLHGGRAEVQLIHSANAAP